MINKIQKEFTQLDTEWKKEGSPYIKITDDIIDYLLTKKDITYSDMKTILQNALNEINYLGLYRV